MTQNETPQNETPKPRRRRTPADIAAHPRWCPDSWTGERPALRGKPWDRCPHTREAMRTWLAEYIEQRESPVKAEHEPHLWGAIDALWRHFNGAPPVTTEGALWLYERNLGRWSKATESIRWLLYSLLDELPTGDGEKQIFIGTKQLRKLDAWVLNNRDLEPDNDSGDYFENEIPGIILLTQLDAEQDRIDGDKCLMLHQPQRDGTVKARRPFPEARKRHLHWRNDGTLDDMVSDTATKPHVPAWDSYLDSLLDGDPYAEQHKQILEEFLGSCLVGIATDYQRVLVLEGSGHNGKSLFLDIVRKLLFKRDQIATSSPEHWGNRFGITDIEGKLVNLVGELGTDAMVASAALKSVVAGDPQRGEIKHGAAYVFCPKTGHILSCNSLPTMTDSSFGFKRRWLPVPFVRDFSRGTAARDAVDIYNELAEVSAEIVQRLVWSAAELMHRGQHTNTPKMQERMVEWSEESDPIAAFVESCLEPEGPVAKWTPQAHIWNAYKDYCADANARPTTNQKFYSALEKTQGIKRTGRQGGARKLNRELRRIAQ